MSRTRDMAKKWTCDGCGVSAGRIDGKLVEMPEAWVRVTEGVFCLICRRERAAEAAIDSAPSDSPVDARAKLRRAAVIEFEIRRTPEQSNGSIAKACRSSATAVARARDRLKLPDATAD